MQSPRSVATGTILIALLICPTVSLSSELSRTHPNIVTMVSDIQRIVLLPPRITMYEIGAGGTVEKQEDWAASAEANVIQAVQIQAGRFDHLRFALFDEQALTEALRANYDETRILYELVNNAILLHTYEPNRPGYFFQKVGDFRYSLGADTQALAPDADAFLIIEGFDQRSSGGRKALQAGTMVIGAVLGVRYVPRGGANLMTVALVKAKTGEVLWHYRSLRPYDLREATSATQFVSDFWTALPTFGK